MPELVHHFEARGANLEALKSKDLKILLAGPAGTGKTRVLLEKAHQLCLRTPGVKCLVVRQTLVSLTASGVQTYQNDVAKEAIADGTVKFFGGSINRPPAFLYSNGSSIALGGMDKPDKVMSTEYDWIYVIEASEVSLESIDKLSSRLRNGRLRGWHQIALDCNPQQPTHPLKIECDQGRMRMLHSRHEDNPRFFNRDGTMTKAGEEYLGILDALTGVRYLRLRKGIWAAAEGVIFDQFQPAVHLIDRFDVPRQWRRIWTVDFGYVHPFVWQDWAVGPDGEMILVREIFKTRTLVEDHARTIKRITAGDPRPHAVICDHDAEDRATLERHLGMATRPANKNVSEGLQATQARFKLINGKPRLMLMRDAVVEPDKELINAKRPACTADEIPGYVWNDKKAEQPVKEMDDGCLVAGTLVKTASGEVPIQRVVPGDRVMTRAGWRPVLAAGETNCAARVFELITSAGTLRGTGNHPVWTSRGWVRMDALRYDDTVMAWSNPSSSEASPIADTPAGAISSLESVTRSKAPRHFIGMSGRRRTVRSRKVTTSITSTSIRRITRLRTFAPCRPQSIRHYTSTTVGSPVLTARRSGWRTSIVSAPLPRRGTLPIRAGNGIRGWRARRIHAAARFGMPASDAVRSMNQGILARSSSAPINAGPPLGARQAPMMWPGRAELAATHSRSTVIVRRSTALARVLHIRALPQPEAVYNLTVDGMPEYFANGILVHNCDTMRYAVAHVDLQGQFRVRFLR